VRKPVNTALGELNGRDAIYLDQLTQTGQKVELIGEINGRLCEPKHRRSAWIRFRLTFMGVDSYESQNVDLCDWPSQSSFDELEPVGPIAESGTSSQKEYVVFTYDWAYRFVAERFEMEVLGERPQER